MDHAAQERTGGDDDGAGAILPPAFRRHAADPAIHDQQPRRHVLTEGQPRLPLQRRLGLAGIEGPVVLGAQRPYRRALAGVQRPELDARGIGQQAHLPAQGVDLPH
ncbi:MAG: hypothetical protein MUF78_10285, partial [Candidatus Edwardsbacteria bacterium]|nr:hypothetical protein [Candidatus Edwardsbacteria bacterium]